MQADLKGIVPKVKAPLDSGFVPAALWNRGFRCLVEASGGGDPVVLTLEQRPGRVFTRREHILPAGHPAAAMNAVYLERMLKFLLWQKGGWKVGVAGCPAMAERLAAVYAPSGERAFDSELIGQKVFGHPVCVESVDANAVPEEDAGGSAQLGRHFDGCRIGFDLGGSDRKCAALVDGKVVHSEEIRWDPYFQKDPQYHWDGIQDSLRRAAAKLPRVDAIGGSAAGIYVDNEVRVASLFRGVPAPLFESRVRGMFKELAREWEIPFQVVNDGEVTALAGSIFSGSNAVLGIAMGTSLAAGYVTPDGGITSWLNELAFAPVDYRADAPCDEWSGDAGCGVQYASQQAVARLCGPAGIVLPPDMPAAEKLVEVQNLMAAGDPRARRIYETLGVYLGYSLAHYMDFYVIREVLLLGRVLSGEGGDVIQQQARKVLDDEFPEASGLVFRVPDEKEKRHGQAMAAASLPALSPG